MSGTGACPGCLGDGEVEVRAEDGTSEMVTCDVCDGTGLAVVEFRVLFAAADDCDEGPPPMDMRLDMVDQAVNALRKRLVARLDGGEVPVGWGPVK